MSSYNRHEDRNGMWGGIILVIIGSLFLLKRLDIGFPSWIFSWEVILIVIGLALGVRRNFKGSGWLICVMIGGFFILKDYIEWWPINVRRFMWPLIIILVGIIIIINSTKRKLQRNIIMEGGSLEDFVNSTVIFSGDKRTVLSKNFKGGQVTAVCGGAKINLLQADIADEAILDVYAVFGGVEIIVPNNWEVVMDVNAMFGGVEDKRKGEFVPGIYSKKLFIKGSCTFAGIEVKAY
ncbi:putative membrane protein [Chitinophaga skermanii]|uniref:Putative membrane protein n=1 Tax=Chitinophaga skermanii TaxID=331697 RepID=A0A327Q6M6_9BACT|nr:DUF5668 domain-containing protein [Chitinophaga skermanii]RAI99411.1 putative membrane protein [Chitinophaga skermanii]